MNGYRRHLHNAVWTLFAALTAILTFASPFAMILLPALAGGGFIALALFWRARADRRAHRQAPHVPDVFGPDAQSTDVINMGRIRVAGVGGLGLVAMAVVVAIGLPRVGQVLMIGGAGGLIVALFVVLRRRRSGPLPSSGGTPGANTVLRIAEGGGDGDGDGEPTPVVADDRSDARRALLTAHAVRHRTV